MGGFLTVGHPAAVGAVHAMLSSHVPHAVLLVGPASVGKHALALDLAAGLLCTGAEGGDRPCRACRSCRMLEHGNHPDLHTAAPQGAGGQIRIGEREHPDPGTIRALITELSLLPVEGVARVAIVRDAHRMNDDAQSALLKTLEEPPAGTTLVLVADDEERLLPTVRSRCARVRLGTLASRDIEALLAARGLADAPTAARLARLSGGRSGLAVAYASAPGAEAIRNEIGRTLLDLLAAGGAARLVVAKELQARANTLAGMLAPPPPPAAETKLRGRGRKAATTASAAAGAPVATAEAPAASDPAASPDGTGTADGTAGADGTGAPDAPAGKSSAAERRRALALLLDAWRDIARDLALAQAGSARSVRDVALLEELEAAARAIPDGSAADALARLVRAGELLESNVSPELVLDVLLVRWPRRRTAA